MIIRQCVSGSYHCNGYSSCSNDSDEEGCSVHVSICTYTNRMYNIMETGLPYCVIPHRMHA